VTTKRLSLTRDQILAYRRQVSALDDRLPHGKRSLRTAAWAGLQDSMPRAALLSIHARVDGTRPDALGDPHLAQIWGPRYSAYVIAREDLAIFTMGRLPDSEHGRQRAEEMANRVDAALGEAKLSAVEAGRALGVHPNALRYASPTGRVLIHWDGARQPTIWTVPRPDVDPSEARLELARRFLHVFGPATATSFGRWAGIKPPGADSVFETLERSLIPVDAPIGDGWILPRDEAAFRSPQEPSRSTRLLPSGDTYFLLQGDDRELLVPDAARRDLLWTSRVWPGAVLLNGAIAGTWRRSQDKVTVSPWRRLTRAEQNAVETEAGGLPLPGIAGQITVRWDQEVV
jgi:hypothetical protein